MAEALVLLAAIGLLAGVWRLARRAESRPRPKGRSIYRGAASHVTIDGRPKVAYPTRAAAEAAALSQSRRGGESLVPYRCGDPRCGRYHLGHP